MDMYRKVRLACAEGMSQREAARHFNISRDSVRKMMAFSVPPGYLTATLEAIAAGHPQSRIDDLTPWAYAAASSSNA